MTLDDLRKIAEAATKGPWAPWPDQDGTPHMNGLLMVGNADAVIPEGETWIEGVDINPIAHVLTPEDREFIATFNPQKVLEMIDENKRLQQRVTRLSNLERRNAGQRDEAQARLAAVEKLHEEVPSSDPVVDGLCDECYVPSPCPTLKAVRGE